MKKFLAILIALIMVSGVMFAANTTLTINSAVESLTKHGFSSSAKDSFGSIITQGDASYENTTNVNLEGTGAQTIGYYSFATTAKIGIDVNFTLNPMANDTFKVAYALNISKADGNFAYTAVDVPANTNTIGQAVAVSAPSIIDLGASTGARWGTFKLDATFAGAANTLFGLPEGDFVGTIVAEIVVQ